MVAPGPPEDLDAARADPRRRFGRYVLLSELGRGGMGVVYRAWDDQVGRLVAVKLTTEERADADSARRFAREVEALTRVVHPGIVPVLDAGVSSGRRFLVMPLVGGGALDTLLAPGAAPIPLARRVTLVRDVARALHAAHAAGIVHRDLKPSNVLLEHGLPLLADFGLARFVEERSRLTKTGAAVGTPDYMAPEQLGGERPVDARTDVWALGALLHFVLTGKPPFEGVTAMNVWTAILRGRVSPPSSSSSEIPPALDAIVLRCMRLEPDERYPSAAAVAEALDEALAAPAGRPRRFVPALVAIAALAAVAGAVSIALRREPPAAVPPAPATERPVAAAPSPVTDPPPDARTPGPTLLRTFSAHGTLRMVALRRDGKALASADEGMNPGTYNEGGVQQWDLEAPDAPPRRTDGFGHGNIVRYSPDGRALLASGREKTVMFVDGVITATAPWDGTEQGPDEVGSPPSGRSRAHLRDAVFLPDGKLLVADLWRKVRILDPATDTLEEVAILFQFGELRVERVDVQGDDILVTQVPQPPALGFGGFDPTRLPVVRRMPEVDREPQVPAVNVSGARFVDGGVRIVSADWSQCGITVWDGKGRPRFVRGSGAGGVPQVAAAGTLVVGACRDGSLIAWDVAGPEPREVWRVERAHAGEVTTVSLTPDGALLASGGYDARVRLWAVPPR